MTTLSIISAFLITIITFFLLGKRIEKRVQKKKDSLPPIRKKSMFQQRLEEMQRKKKEKEEKNINKSYLDNDDSMDDIEDLFH